MKDKVITFAAGPTKVPTEVKETIRKEMLDFNGTGLSILETMHRSKPFVKLLETCEKNVRQVLSVPENYKILFLQGGATAQFAAVAMNLFGGTSKTADYLITGMWSVKALQEARKYGECREVCPLVPDFKDIPPESTYELNPEAAYLFYCDNETISGVEFSHPPTPPEGVPLVCDMSSNILSKPVDVSKYGVIFAGTQKNFGCSGCTVVIVREDLLDRALAYTPGVLNYAQQAKAGSMYNTPPTFTIYVANLICQWIKENGGLENMDVLSRQKSAVLYSAIDQSNGFYRLHPAQAVRSRVNVVFRLQAEDLENRWVEGAEALGLQNVRGHRTVGGLRISLYNAHTMEDAHIMAQYMLDFRQRYTAGQSSKQFMQPEC
uniref:Phosphoserine aminotransferase n=1 Tax=Schistocephalus solidus TaxID=70667 RepID=A0A0V0J406_SCHSO